MEIRRAFTAGLWLATTVAATALVWTATSVVASDVTDRPAPVVAHRDVVIALASGSPAASTTTVPALIPTAPTTAVSHPGTARVPTTPAPSQASSTTTRPPAAGPAPLGFPPAGPATIGVLPASNTTLPHPVTTTTTHAAPATVIYSTRGGVVTIACTSPSSIRMVSASPNDGYRVYLVNPGPFEVEVHFIGYDDVPVKVVCFFGQPFRIDFGAS